MNEVDVASLLVLMVVGGAPLFSWGRSFLGEYIESIFYGTAGLIFVYEIYQSIELFNLWLGHEFGKLFLPPYQDFTYFYFEALTRFFAPYIASFVFAILVLYVASWYNRKFDNKFFEKEEPYMAALSIFLTGHPGWILYLFVTFGAYLVFHTLIQLRPSMRGERLPLYHFWVPSAVFVILISEYVLAHNYFWLKLSL